MEQSCFNAVNQQRIQNCLQGYISLIQRMIKTMASLKNIMDYLWEGSRDMSRNDHIMQSSCVWQTKMNREHLLYSLRWDANTDVCEGGHT